MIWGETATKKIWGQKTNGYCGQHVQLAYGVSGWILEEWKPPECMGVTPEQWYEQSWQPDAQLHILGDFPFRGYYSPCIHLYAQHWEGEKLITEPQELNYNVLTMLVPAIFQARAMTFRQKQTFIRQQMMENGGQQQPPAPPLKSSGGQKTTPGKKTGGGGGQQATKMINGREVDEPSRAPFRPRRAVRKDRSEGYGWKALAEAKSGRHESTGGHSRRGEGD